MTYSGYSPRLCLALIFSDLLGMRKKKMSKEHMGIHVFPPSHFMTEDITQQLISDLETPQPKQKTRKWRASDQNKQRRGPRRPYRGVSDELLTKRVNKYQSSVDRAKKVHDKALTILQNYLREKNLRDHNEIQRDTESQITE
jgi:hypothetical protein